MLYKFLLLIKTQTDKQTDRQADRQTDGQTNGQAVLLSVGFPYALWMESAFSKCFNIKKRKRKEDDSVICNKTFNLFETYNAKLGSRTHRFVLSLGKS